MTAPLVHPTPPKPKSPRRARSSRLNPLVIGGVALIVGMLAVGFIAPHFLPDPLATAAADASQPPSAEHWFGTDRYGRDVLARTIDAIQLDLTLALACAIAAFTVGTVLGTLAGFMGGVVDEIIMRFIDILAAFPAFVLAILVAFALGDGVVFAVAGVALAAVPEFVRLTRARALSIRRQDFVLASRVLGVRALVIAWTHVAPNSTGPAIVQAAFVGGSAILYLAGLAFLGVGVHPPQAEWGVMISEGSAEIVRGIWWSSLFPGLFILLAAVGFHLISDGMARGQHD